MSDEATTPRIAAGTIINKDNFNEVARAVLSGATLTVTSGEGGGGLIGYTPQFFPIPWVDFVDPVQAGGDNGFNKRFQDIVKEFDSIAAAISSVDDAVANLQTSGGSVIGLATVSSSRSPFKIPLPKKSQQENFQQAETKFFAFPINFFVSAPSIGTDDIRFLIQIGLDGTVNFGTGSGQSLVVTGIALAKEGGW